LEAGVINFHPEKYKIAMQDVPFHTLDKFPSMVWQGKKIVHWKEEVPSNYSMISPLAVDYLVLSHDAVTDPQQIFKFFKPEIIIFAASNSYYKIQKLKVYFEAENIDFYDISENGAFELKM
jgi:hypothetical protein